MSKNILGATLLYLLLYVGIIFCTELPGFLSPYYWVGFGIVAAFAAAGPLTFFAYKTGSVLLIPIAWLFLNRAIGECGMDLMVDGALCLLTIGAILALVYGDNRQKMIRACVPVLVAMPSCNLLPLYFQTEQFEEAALEEMDAQYVSQMLGCAHIWVFFVVSTLVIGAGIVSQRLTEKNFIKV